MSRLMRRRAVGALTAALLAGSVGCGGDDNATGPLDNAPGFPTVLLPQGFRIEKVVGGLTYPTGIAWDEQGQMYVLEAGGQFVEEPPPARLLRVAGGQATEVVNLTAKGVIASAVGLAYQNGAFFFTHRAADRTGAVSRATLDGQVTQILSGILDAQSEHQPNDIRVGPDGRMYIGTGPAGNAGVVGLDLAFAVMRSPMVHTTPCQDIVLTGQNFQTPDFRTPEANDLVLTGAYVPFGTPTTPGQVIPGTNKCGGSVLVFDPNNAEGTVRPFASGLRNVIGLAWNQSGQMFAAVNGYDVRGSRPVNDTMDATYRIQEGAWYGYPDYTLGLKPVTDAAFDVPDPLKAPRFVNGEPQGKTPAFVIDQQASGLTVADPSLIVGVHEINSSPSIIDFAPESWGDMAGDLFVTEWGDLAPGTTPLRGSPSGFRIVRLEPGNTQAVPFATNVMPGPASAQGAAGQGLERPFGLRFGPDGAMYIVDYGVGIVDPAMIAQGKPPYEFPPGTGAVWRITRTGAD